MALDTSGEWWTGTDESDIDAYLVGYMGESHAIDEVVHATCVCGAKEFLVDADGEQGCVVRTCPDCGVEHAMCDSAEYLADSELDRGACVCGRDRLELAVGFVRRGDGSISWLAVGARCVHCGVLASPADWKIDYAPSGHLPTQV